MPDDALILPHRANAAGSNFRERQVEIPQRSSLLPHRGVLSFYRKATGHLGAMKRREFITLLGGAAVWPGVARAQQAARMRRVGVLMATAADDPEGQARMAAFLQGLQQWGHCCRRPARCR